MPEGAHGAAAGPAAARAKGYAARGAALTGHGLAQLIDRAAAAASAAPVAPAGTAGVAAPAAVGDAAAAVPATTPLRVRMGRQLTPLQIPVAAPDAWQLQQLQHQVLLQQLQQLHPIQQQPTAAAPTAGHNDALSKVLEKERVDCHVLVQHLWQAEAYWRRVQMAVQKINT